MISAGGRVPREEAIAKYGEALKYVPKWAALEEARDAAAKQKT